MCDSDRWPIPPYHPEDYWALLELLGPEEVRADCATGMSQPAHPLPPDGSTVNAVASAGFRSAEAQDGL